MYYAIHDGEDYLATGLNATDKEELGQDLDSYQENQFDSEADFKRFKALTPDEKVAHLGWKIDESETPFPDPEDDDGDYSDKVAVCPECYSSDIRMGMLDDNTGNGLHEGWICNDCKAEDFSPDFEDKND